MPKVFFELNSKGVVELMKSAEMSAIVTAAAQQVASSASGISNGGQFEVVTKMSGDRVAGGIRTADEKAFRSTMDDNAVEKALRGTTV